MRQSVPPARARRQRKSRRLVIESLEPRITPAGFGDFIWKDTNANGLQDGGEAGVAGVAVRLYKGWPNQVLIASKTTDANGQYLFDTNSLASGTDYWLQMDVPSGYILSPWDVGSNDAIDNDFYSSSSWTNYYTLGPGVTNLSADGGLVPNGSGPGSVGNRVWKDNNANGRQDAGEPGIAGVTVELTNNGSVVATTTTDANGNYTFDMTNRTTSNRYWLELVVPTGYSLSPSNVGTDDAIDNDFYSSQAWTDYYTLGPGIINDTVDAGLVPDGTTGSGSVGDRVWQDDNANGLQDAGEPGVSGVTVRLIDNGSTVATTTTNASGNYAFDMTGRAASQWYWLEIDLPAGYTLSPLDAGTDDEADNDFYSSSAWTDYRTLGPTFADLSVDAGLVPTSTARTVSINDVSVTEGAGATATFTVSLSEAPSGPVSVNFATANGSAAAGSDYTASSGTVSFATGETSKTIAIPILDDAVWEGNETFTVNLSNSVGAAILDGTGIGTIVENEPAPTVSISDATLVEGDTGAVTATFTVTLSGAIQNTFDYRATTANGTALGEADFRPISSILRFGAGLPLTRTVTVQVYGDRFTEADETFTVNVARVQGGPVVADGSGLGTIVDDDPTRGDMKFAPVAWGFAHDQQANGSYETLTTGYGPGSLPVARFAPDYEYRTMFEYDVSRVNTAAVIEVMLTFNTYPFPSAGFGGPIGLVAYGANGAMELGDATAAGPAVGSYVPSATAGARQTIFLDRDQVLALTGGSSWLGVRFQAISNGSSSGVFGPLNGPDWTPHLTFLTTTPPVPAVSVSDVSLAEGNPAGGTSGSTAFNFTVSLSLATTVPVTVNFATADGTASNSTDYTARTGTLTFEAGETTRTVAVSVRRDSVYERDETFTLNLSNPTRASLGDAQGLGTIRNDDAAPAIAVTPVVVDEGDTGTTAATFTVTLTGLSDVPATVDYTTADGTATAGSDYTAIGGTLTFAPRETSKTVAVPVHGDTDLEPNETFTFRLANAVEATLSPLSSPTVTGTIVNDDSAPVANAGPDQSADEPATVAFDGSASFDPDGDPLTFTWDFGDGTTGTGPTPTHIYPDSGTYTARLTVDDGHGGVASDTLVVTVRNLAPTAAGLTGPIATTEGAAVTYALAAPTDPSPVDAGSLRYSFALTEAGLAAGYNAASATNSFAPPFTDNGSYTVYARVYDKDGGISPTFSRAVTVANVTPAVSATGTSPINEATTFTGSGSFTDPGADTWSATVDYGDGTGVQPLALNPDRTFALSHVYADNGSFTVTVKVTDDDGDTGTRTVAVTVVNLAPTATAGGATRGVRGQTLAFSFSATDPSAIDQGQPFIYAIDWGDGSSESASGPAAGVGRSHVYAAAGTFTVRVTATDKDGGTSAEVTRTVTVVAAELQNGDLVVGGTNAGETITLRPANGSGGIGVTIGGTSLGTFTPAAAGQIVVRGLDGNDTIEMLTTRIGSTTYRITKRAVVYGGAGNDVIHAGGSNGDSVLLGGAGNDTVTGGGDRDVLVGGLGSDVLTGGAGDDILIGGLTDHDDNLAAWKLIVDEWSRTDLGYTARMDHLAGTLPNGRNGTTFLNATTLDDDGGAADTLTGEGQNDWFLTWAADTATDKKNGERQTTLP